MSTTTFDKFLFTDNPDIEIDGVETVVDQSSGLPPALASRRYKLHPGGPLHDYDLTIYLDNRSSLKDGAAERIASVANAAPDDVGLWLFQHHQRDCVYEEGHACRRRKVQDKKRLDRQLAHYRAEGLPRKSGLYCGTFLVRRKTLGALDTLARTWTEHFHYFCERDQISLGFLIWKLQLAPEILPGTLIENDLIEWPVISGVGRRRHGVAIAGLNEE